MCAHGAHGPKEEPAEPVSAKPKNAGVLSRPTSAVQERSRGNGRNLMHSVENAAHRINGNIES